MNEMAPGYQAEDDESLRREIGLTTPQDLKENCIIIEMGTPALSLLDERHTTDSTGAHVVDLEYNFDYSVGRGKLWEKKKKAAQKAGRLPTWASLPIERDCED